MTYKVSSGDVKPLLTHSRIFVFSLFIIYYKIVQEVRDRQIYNKNSENSSKKQH